MLQIIIIIVYICWLLTYSKHYCVLYILPYLKSQQLSNFDTIIIPILQMRELWPSVIKYLAQGRTKKKKNSSKFDSKALVLTCHVVFHYNGQYLQNTYYLFSVPYRYSSKYHICITPLIITPVLESYIIIPILKIRKIKAKI